jgi:hypothetical protein
MNSRFSALLLCIAVVSVLAVIPASGAELTELRSLGEMETAVESRAKVGDTGALLRGLKSPNSFLRIMIVRALEKHNLRISLADVAELMKQHAEPIDGSEVSTAHDDFKSEFLQYASKLTGKPYQDPGYSPEGYRLIATEIEQVARSSGMLSSGSDKVSPQDVVRPGSPIGWLVGAAITIAVLVWLWTTLKKRP